MIWQDIVLTICSLSMGYALVPQIYLNFKNKECKINLQTSGITFAALLVAAFAYSSLNLVSTFILTSVIGVFWFILFLQKIFYRKQ